jgi:protein-glutamine gamma-glutamyltransferase
MSLVEAIRRANRPGPAEDSIRLRVACLGTVLVAIAACASMGELSWPFALGAMTLVSAGMAFSYRTRTRPPLWVKIFVAVGAIAATVWFFHSVVTPDASVTSVENPLTVLLAVVLTLHSFHVPSRRDLMFSLAASSALMAAAGAQAIDLQFGYYVVAWAGFGLWGLTEMWTSASGGGRASALGLGAALVAMATAAGAIFLVLPAPNVAARVAFLTRAGLGGSIGVPGALAGDSGSPVQLARSGTSSDPTRVGGYLGFANSLNTALRGQLGNSLVMQVRAQRPSYWVGETFNAWDGQNWAKTGDPTRSIRQQSPFVLPVPDGDVPFGQTDLQTFYVASSTADLVFHAETASEVWFPSSKVFYSEDGTIVSPIGLGTGSIYSVASQVSSPSPDDLRTAIGGLALPPSVRTAALQLPHPYPRVEALAQSITAGDANNYDRVQSLIAWIGAHTHYSTDIPPLAAGADTVDEFLFGNRVGFCEQISTSLAVMLRSLGIPAREAVGYVPGPYNPITDLYEIHADDAHAWVQVWFPGYGWQNFDPTAVVPLANPAPGATALQDLGAVLARVPLVPVSGALFAVVLAFTFVRIGRARPRTWVEHVARSAERAGRRAGRPRRPSESFVEYAAVLDQMTGNGSMTWRRLASSVEEGAYGGLESTSPSQRRMMMLARRTRIPRRSDRFHTRGTP